VFQLARGSIVKWKLALGDEVWPAFAKSVKPERKSFVACPSALTVAGAFVGIVHLDYQSHEQLGDEDNPNIRDTDQRAVATSGEQLLRSADAHPSSTPAITAWHSCGEIWSNGQQVAVAASWRDGDSIGIVVDFSQGLLSFYKNGLRVVTTAESFTGRVTACAIHAAHRTSSCLWSASFTGMQILPQEQVIRTQRVNVGTPNMTASSLTKKAILGANTQLKTMNTTRSQKKIQQAPQRRVGNGVSFEVGAEIASQEARSSEWETALAETFSADGHNRLVPQGWLTQYQRSMSSVSSTGTSKASSARELVEECAPRLIGDVSPLYVNTSSSTVQAASELASDLGLVPMPLSRRMVYALCSDTLRSGPCSINDLLGCVLRAAALKKFSENIRPRQRLRHLIEECGMDDAVKVWRFCESRKQYAESKISTDAVDPYEAERQVDETLRIALDAVEEQLEIIFRHFATEIESLKQIESVLMLRLASVSGLSDVKMIFHGEGETALRRVCEVCFGRDQIDGEKQPSLLVCERAATKLGSMGLAQLVDSVAGPGTFVTAAYIWLLRLPSGSEILPSKSIPLQLLASFLVMTSIATYDKAAGGSGTMDKYDSMVEAVFSIVTKAERDKTSAAVCGDDDIIASALRLHQQRCIRDEASWNIDDTMEFAEAFDIVPELFSKSELSDVFSLANMGEVADDSAKDVSWDEFLSMMRIFAVQRHGTEGQGTPLSSLHDILRHMGLLDEDTKQCKDWERHLRARRIGGERVTGKKEYFDICDTLDIMACKPIVKSLENARVNLCHYTLRFEDMTALSAPMRVNNICRTLVLDDCGITEASCEDLLVALHDNQSITELSLSFNVLRSSSASIIAGLLAANASLLVLRLQGCALTDRGGGTIVSEGLSDPYRGSLELLDMRENSLGSESARALAKLLPVNSTLTELDLRWNSIRSKAGGEFLTGVSRNSSLRSLKIGWNGCGTVASHIGTAISGCSSLTELDLSHNQIDQTGAHMIGAGLRSSVVLRSLCVVGNPLGLVGGRALMKAAASRSESTDGLRQSGSSGIEGFQLDMKGCNLGIANPHAFDPSEPNGEYCLDLSDPYSHFVLRTLLVMKQQGTGVFSLAPTRDGRLWPSVLRPAAIDEMFPKSGIVKFSFSEVASKPSCVASSEMTLLKKLIKESSLDVSSIIGMASKGNVTFKTSEAVNLIDSIQDRQDRVAAFLKVFSKLETADGIAVLTNQFPYECSAVLSQCSDAVLAFTQRNPTGRYKLRMNDELDRELMLGLALCASTQADKCRKERAKLRRPLESKLNPPEQNFLNLQQSGRKGNVLPKGSVPRQGTLVFDFVSTQPPNESEPQVSPALLKAVLGVGAPPRPNRVWHLWNVPRSESSGSLEIDRLPVAESELGTKRQQEHAVELLRVVSNDFVFTLDQAIFCVKRTTIPALQEELLIMFFARIVEYNCFGYLMQRVSRSVQEAVKTRLGKHTLFSVVTAVGYYELDLSLDADRFVASELVHLAVEEPGENMVDETFNGISFECPSAWCNRVPDKGLYTVFYCREKSTIEKILDRVPERSIHCMYRPFQPSGTGWVEYGKRRMILAKLSDRFHSPEECFAELDKDGGGELSRSELAVGLRSVGIWLHPDEVSDLLQCLDEDESGTIEVEELAAFWEKYG